MAREIDQKAADTFYDMGSINYYVSEAYNALLVELVGMGAPPDVIRHIFKRRDEVWENCRRDAMAFLKAHMGSPHSDRPWPDLAKYEADITITGWGQE